MAIAALCFCTYIGLRLLFPYPPGVPSVTGDEPYYLQETHTILHQTDLDLNRNFYTDFQNQTYRAFYTIGPIAFENGFVPYKGRLVLVHPMLGVPLIVLPAYAIGGQRAVVVFLSGLMALAVASLYLTCLQVTPRRVALVTAVGLGLTYPIIIYSQQLFPDALAFIVIALVLAFGLRPQLNDGIAGPLAVGFLLGLLPHLHEKMVLLSAPLWFWYLWRGKQQWLRRAVLSAIPLTIMALLAIACIAYLFGDLNFIEIANSVSFGTYWDAKTSGLAAFVGLLFDQEYGLLFYAPYLMLAAVGLWLCLRDPARRGDSLFLLGAAVLYYLNLSSWRLWEGGYSPAGRMLIPLVPMFVVWSAVGLQKHWSARWWLPVLLLAASNLFITALVVVHRTLSYTSGMNANTILRQEYHAEWLIQWLPGFRYRNTLDDYAHLVMMLLAIIVIWCSTGWLSSRWNWRLNSPSNLSRAANQS